MGDVERVTRELDETAAELAAGLMDANEAEVHAEVLASSCSRSMFWPLRAYWWAARAEARRFEDEVGRRARRVAARRVRSEGGQRGRKE